jgi:hypothetical protein
LAVPSNDDSAITRLSTLSINLTVIIIFPVFTTCLYHSGGCISVTVASTISTPLEKSSWDLLTPVKIFFD